MPSSHMTVMVGFTYWVLKNYKNKPNALSIKIVLIIMCILQGMARFMLNYHTVAQIIGGFLFGILSVSILSKIIDSIYIKNKENIFKYLPIVDDSQ